MAGKIDEARKEIGMSRAEMSRRMGIPIRTLESWSAGVRKCPEWTERLILDELKRIKEKEEGQ